MDFQRAAFNPADWLEEPQPKKTGPNSNTPFTASNSSNQAAMRTLLTKFCPSDAHHTELRSFVGACNSIAISEEECLDFLLSNTGCISPQSSYYNNNDQLQELVADIYKRYHPSFGKFQQEPKNQKLEEKDTTSFESNFDFQTVAFSLEKPKEMPLPVISSTSNDIICSAGNITTVAGQAKSGKTAFNSAILAGAIAPQGTIIDTLGLVIQCNTEKKAVLHYDSEQSEYNHFKFFKGVYARAGRSKDLDFFGSWNIRKNDVKERMPFIEQSAACYAKRYNGVFLIVLDGIADLMNNPNDYEESNIIIDRVEKLAIQYNCPVITVLHFNPGSDKERGHLGSQLQRKSESVLSIIKDGTQSVLTGKYLRNAGEIPEVRFEYNKEKGYHTLVDIITPQVKQQAKAQAKELKTEKQINLLREEFGKLFYDNKPIQYTALSKSYVAMIGCSTATANRAVTTAKELGILSVDIAGLYILNK